ncbi:MAG: DNA polymerase III subunit delta [Planctomycetota bacterium]|jgi:DNA polymerase-3 subunit delta
MPPKKQQDMLGFYVIYGEDPFLVANECEKLVRSILGSEDPTMALYEPKASDAQISDVLDELRTLPFLTSKRVVLIKDAEPFVSAHADALEAYLDRTSPTGVLILTLTSWDKRRRLHKKMQKTGGLIEVGKLYSNQLPAYVASYAQQNHAIRLDGQASRFLVELVGDDPGRLCREMDKLVMYVAPRKTVSVNDIESLIGHNRMFNAFDVIDAITSGRTGAAVSRIRNMFQADKNAEFTVVGAFGYHFRRLFRAKGMISKGLSPQQAAAKTGVRYKQNEFLQQLNRLSLHQLAWVLSELGRIDFGMKTGQTSAPIAIERLVLKLFAMQKSPAFR